MALRDMLARDLDAFFNESDFATRHKVEGSEILVIEDRDALQENKASLGLSEAVLAFRANVKDLPQRKTSGSLLNYDGRDYTVADWSVDAGMATVTLSLPQTI